MTTTTEQLAEDRSVVLCPLTTPLAVAVPIPDLNTPGLPAASARRT